MIQIRTSHRNPNLTVSPTLAADQTYRLCAWPTDLSAALVTQKDHQFLHHSASTCRVATTMSAPGPQHLHQDVANGSYSSSRTGAKPQICLPDPRLAHCFMFHLLTSAEVG